MAFQESANISLILKQLESTSSSVVFRGLQDIRCKLLRTPNGVHLFKENNGLKYLIRFVRKPNEKILDLTLSILANLCLENDVKLVVAEENGMVVHILGLVAHMQKDSIVGRACRLLGNLATCKTIAIKLYQKGAVPKLIESIKSKDTSPGTKQMAVRALRLLWEAEVNRAKMIQDQVVQTVASLLSTQVDELLQAVLKGLAVFTHHCNEQCALQVQGDGNGFEELVASIKTCSKSELPISVILNLCFVPEVRPLLGTAGVVEAVIGLTSGQSPQQYSSDVVSIVCLLSRDSVNRSKIRRNGGLEVLLETLRSGTHPNTEARALNAMLHFIYDEVGLEILIREGLVPVLVNKLIKVVDNYGNIHISQTCKEVSISVSTNSNHSKRLRLTSSKEESASYSFDKDRDPLGLRAREPTVPLVRLDCNFYGGQWSPGSSRSGEFSPDANRTYSPSPHNVSCSPTSSGVSPASQFSPPSPLSDAYSPVCGYSSDEEENPDVTDVEAGGKCEDDSDCDVTSPSLKDKDDFEDIQEALRANIPSTLNSRPRSVESWCLLMLSRVSHMDSLVDDMVSSNTIDALLQYYTLLEPPHQRAARILQRITRNHHCLIPLLRAGFVLKVNARLTQRIHEGCTRCTDIDEFGNSLLSQLSLIAESGFGEGEIIHHLMRATRPVQAYLIVSVPYIIRKRKLLKQMLNCKIDHTSGLGLLLQLITDECGDGLVLEAIDSVSLLAQHINTFSKDAFEQFKIKTKLCERTAHDCSVQGQKLSCSESNHDVVSLMLDSGSTISVARGELCRESPMFLAMFTGGFHEAGRHCVTLKEVSKESFSALLSLMKSPSGCACCLSNVNVQFAFEVLKLADRFILPKVVVKVADWLVSQLTPDKVSAFYMQAQHLRHVLSTSEKLSNQSLYYALSKEVDNKKRHEIFLAILNSDCKEQFMDDLSLFIKSRVDNPS